MTVLVSDSFNRTATTSGLGTTDSYNGGTNKAWTAVSGTLGINSSQQAYLYLEDGTTNFGISVVDSGVSDCSVSVTVIAQQVSGSTNNHILALRVTDKQNLIYVSGGIGKPYKLIKRSSGTETTLASGGTPANGDVVKVTLNGSTITVIVNGSSLFNATDSFNSTLTKHGLALPWPKNVIVDNFILEDLNASGTGISISSTVKSASSSNAAATLSGSSNTPVALSSITKSNSSATTTAKSSISLVASVKSNTIEMATIKTSSTLGSTTKSNTNANGTAKNTITLSNTVKSNTATNSTLKGNQALSSTVKSNTGTSNTVKNTVSLTITNKSNTSSNATITLTAQGGLASTVKNTSYSNAKLTVNKQLSATNKSTTSENGAITKNIPLNSITKSNSTENAPIRSFQLITSNDKSNTLSTSHLSIDYGITHISSNVKSNTSMNTTLNTIIFLITANKSNSNERSTLTFVGVPDYEQIIKYNLYIKRMLEFNSNIKSSNNTALNI